MNASLLVMLSLIAQVDAPAKEPLPAAPPAPTAEGTRRALIICGLAGDAPHRKLFGDSMELLYKGLTEQHGFAPENVALLWGDESVETDGPAVMSSTGVTSKETLIAATDALRQQLQPEDALWVFVFGHAHYDSRYSWLNIAGDDLHQNDIGKLFAGLACREQVYFVTTAASGFYAKPLAAPGRVIVTATEPDLEVNETLFPHKLARALGATPPSYAELDLDHDWRLTLLDVFLWCTRETAQDYVTGELLATEHALLDDNGDGRGTEIQVNYLPEELGGRKKASDDWPAAPTGDGALAQRIRLAFPPSPPVPDLLEPEPKATVPAPPAAEQPVTSK